MDAGCFGTNKYNYKLAANDYYNMVTKLKIGTSKCIGK